MKQTETVRCFAIFPMHTVVLVRMLGSGSSWSLEKKRSKSLLIIFSGSWKGCALAISVR